jgi:hypothetical protein
MPRHDLLNRARELRRLAEWLGFAQLHELAGDATRGRLFAEIAEDLREVFFAVGVDDVGCGELAARV